MQTPRTPRARSWITGARSASDYEAIVGIILSKNNVSMAVADTLSLRRPADRRIQVA